MIDFAMVWIGASLLCLGAFCFARSRRKRRFIRPKQLHWPGVLILCTIAGAVPAYLYDVYSARAVDLPPELATRPDLPAAQSD